MRHLTTAHPRRIPAVLVLIAIAAIVAVAAFTAVMNVSAQSEELDWKQSPTGLTVTTGDNAGELDLAWDAHPQTSKTLQDYRVTWTPDGDAFRPNSETEWYAYPTTHQVTVTGLDAGETDKVRVRARYDDNKKSSWSDVVSGQAGVTPNSPATGQPAIAGTAEVGETLTAGTSAISDDNGLTNATFTYQWIRNTAGGHTDISGATNAAYVITSDDTESKIQVRVRFTDDDGYAETRTSSSTAVVTEPAADQPQQAAAGDAGTATPRSSHLAPPTNLRVSSRTTTAITFTWDSPTDSDVTHTYVEWVHPDSSGNQNYADVRTSRTVAGVAQNTAVTIRVQWATGPNSADRGALVGKVSKTLADKQAQNLAVLEKTAESVTLTWDNPSNYNVTGFEIERRTGSGTYTTLHERTTTDTGYTDSNVVGNTMYTYRVTIRHRPSGENLSQDGNGVTLDVTTPNYADIDAPTNFRIVNATLTSGVYVLANHDDDPELKWNKPTGATGYKFTRKWIDSDATCGTSCPWLVVALARGNGHNYFTDRYIAPGKYTFRIRGLDANNNPGPAAEKTVQLPDGLPFVPEAPTNFGITAGKRGNAATLEGEWHRNDSPPHKIPPAFVVQWKSGTQDYPTSPTANRSIINAWSGPYMLGADGNDQWSPAWNKLHLRHNFEGKELDLDTEYTVRVGMCLTTACDLDDVVFAAELSARTPQ